MNDIDIIFGLLGILSPFISFYLLNVVNFRAERVVCEFRFALQEKYPRSYVNQTKIIKKVRRICRMGIKEKIHWAHSLGNYLQLFVLFMPGILLVLFILLDVNRIFYKICFFCFNVLVAWSIFVQIFTLILCFICKKIKKTNPKYSKCGLRDW